jgi:hypothetical protein
MVGHGVVKQLRSCPSSGVPNPAYIDPAVIDMHAYCVIKPSSADTHARYIQPLNCVAVNVPVEGRCWGASLPSTSGYFRDQLCLPLCS